MEIYRKNEKNIFEKLKYFSFKHLYTGRISSSGVHLDINHIRVFPYDTKLAMLSTLY